MTKIHVKQEAFEPSQLLIKNEVDQNQIMNNNAISISSSSSDGSVGSILFGSDSDDSDVDQGRPTKKQRVLAALPIGFLDPLKPEERFAMQLRNSNKKNEKGTVNDPLMTHRSGSHDFDIKSVKKEPLLKEVEAEVEEKSVFKSCSRSKQFWKAGDYEAGDATTSAAQSAGIDHVRVHPKFLHSNATSHKWALGAFAELLDNALDEVSNEATYVHVDVIKNKKERNAMLKIEDNGGGMTPDRIRQCMSLGYSAKSKLANTIGQYGNGFKTSTMRLGADVIVFSRCKGMDEGSATQSIGMLSYTFLRGTGKEDIVVPMIDYEKRGDAWSMMIRSTTDDWNRNLEMIAQWSPYQSEEDLFLQFEYLKDQGTRIIIYNLWEDDQGSAELDFDSDENDIQIRGVNRDEKKIQMAKNYPNVRHYLTYRHSLRNYAAILYLRIPPGFRIILRGKDIEHYNIINDLIHSRVITYRPQGFPEEATKDQNMVAVLNIGFINDAKYHLDVQGFNVYHKNRLIKPFWRVWNAAGSDGRGVIGVLEANFVEPAHDKQGFERTIVFSRLESRLIAIQKTYWSTNCHKVGYAKRGPSKNSVSPEKKTSPKHETYNSNSNSKAQISNDGGRTDRKRSNGKIDHRLPVEHEKTKLQVDCKAISSSGETQPECVENCEDKLVPVPNGGSEGLIKLKEENDELRASLEDVLRDLQNEKDRNQSLEHKLQEARKRIAAKDKEQEKVANVLRQERSKRESTEEALSSKIQLASDVIQELRDKIKLLERNRTAFLCKPEK